MILAGRYLLDSEIGRGGLATVWRATDRVLSRTVAVKILHEHLAREAAFRKRFELESMAAARLTHANIIGVFDTGEQEGSPFVVMEYATGGTLRDLLDLRRRLTSGEAAALGAEISAALAHAHSEDQVHGDIKPTNILFTEAGLAKLSDFGIARAAIKERFGRGALTPTAGLGGVFYLAPEQVMGKDPSPASDIYSLCCVLYEALAGELPWDLPDEGTQDLEIAAVRVETPPIPLGDRISGSHRRLDEVIMRGLEREPLRRHTDAAALERSLSRVVEEFRPKIVERSLGSKQEEKASFVRTEGRWLIPTVLLVLIGVALVAAVLRFQRSLDLSQIVDLIGGGGDREASSVVEVVRGGIFDPEGEGSENNARVPAAFDGDPSSAWKTSSYASERFGELKDGVGIWFDLGRARNVSQVEVRSVIGGYAAALRSSEDANTWSEVGPTTEVLRTNTFEGSGSHRYWMIWIVGLVATPGQGTDQFPYSVGIAEVRFLA